MSCEDPDCPACQAQAFIRCMAEEGMDPSMIIELFFFALGEVFDVEYVFQQIQEAVEEAPLKGTVH